MLKGKKVLIGVTGSIAAYKAAFLVRLLIKSGCEVRVVMTKSATEFISTLTLSTLSKHAVMVEWNEEGVWNNHVEIGMWADIFLVAPCTASTLSKMATGLADNMLMACYLSAKCPVAVAPAMDLDMWKHPSTLRNIQSLKNFGNLIIPVGNGFLASGLEGEGRMAEPEDILLFLEEHFKALDDLRGKKVLITAGPTYELIDPVRFIGNFSSGKMGYALAEACSSRGADVTLVTGPVNIKTDDIRIKVIKVRTAAQMYEACVSNFKEVDIAILAAAVADYRPAEISDQKIKKQGEDLTLALVKTVDIAANLGQLKTENQVMIGFALETNDEINHATQKLHKKNFDFIVLNSLGDQGAGFQHDTNKVTILDKNGAMVVHELKPKTVVANDIVDYLVLNYIAKNE